MRKLALIMLALAASLGVAHAAGPSRPVVVELFTSQGCSSCPPADTLLRDLAQTRANILPLSIHVTYWNSLGWRDPFSSDAGTARQARYVALLGLDGAYTPQIVVDGRTNVVGFDRPGVLAAIGRASAAPSPSPSPASVSVQRQAGQAQIMVGSGAGAGTILLVGYDPQHRTEIGRGENSGRTLLEANIVRSLTEVGQWRGGAVQLSTALPQGERVAVIIQAADGSVLGAAAEPRS